VAHSAGKRAVEHTSLRTYTQNTCGLETVTERFQTVAIQVQGAFVAAVGGGATMAGSGTRPARAISLRLRGVGNGAARRSGAIPVDDGRRVSIAPEQTDDTARQRWEQAAREIEQLNLSDPLAGAARAEAWLAEETGGEGRARALRAVAYGLRSAGVYDRCEPRFVEAEDAFVALGMHDDAARTRIGHVEALRYLGRLDDAIALAKNNLAYLLSRGPGFGLDVARQRINLGLVYWRRGDLERALATFGEARAYGEQENIRELVATALNNMGLVLNELGRYGEALEAGRYAAREHRAMGSFARLATVEMNLGLLHISRGEYGQALEALTTSRGICQDLGLEQKRAAVDVDLTRAYRALRLDAEAAESCGHAIESFRKLDLPFELATALLLRGQIAEGRGDTNTARRDLGEAQALYQRVGNAAWETIAALAGLRLAVADAGRHTLPALLAEAKDFAERLRTLSAPQHAADASLLVADIQVRLGQQEAARATLRTALALGAQLGADGVLYQAHLAEGLILEEDAPDEARASYEQAVEHLERLRARSRADDLKQAVVGQGESLYERLARLLLGPVATYCEACAPQQQRAINTRGRDAFRWLERGKSRGLLEDTLGDQVRTSAPSPRLSAARELVAELRARLNAAYNTKYGLDAPAAPSLSAPAAQAPAVPADDLERLELELSRATRNLQILMRGDGALDVAALVDVERVQAALDDRTCLVEYVVLGDEVACFVLRREHFAVYRNIARREQVERSLSWFWFHIRKGTYGAEFLRANHRSLSRSVDQALQQLGDMLLAPIAGALANAEHLVMVPHGLLHGVPIHALTYKGGILLDAATVSYAPSASVFAAGAGRPSPNIGRPLVIAPDIADLPWVQEEARRIAQEMPGTLVLSGQQATLARLRSEAPSHDCLHLATHGVFRADNPTYSALELADGWLSVGELAELSRGRGLVCLSACHTGMSGVGPGDELMGLTRAVLGAGASALVASLWAANDDTAPEFMSTFYAGLHAGHGRAASLRAAALDMRKREPHPYFWAPFILVGAP
jgi:tetratricopeptide (TPR) repeat protein